MKITLSPRSTYFYLALACFGLIAAALVMQYGFNYQPCALCTLQRFFFVVLMVLFLITGLHYRANKYLFTVYNCLILLSAGLGMLIAGRQVWLQHLPPEAIPSCGPSLNYMLQHLPLWDTLRLVFEGSGDCAHIDWMWLGLSLAGWSFLFFAAFAISTVITFFRKRNR